jgi:hypothetical protein
MADQLQDVWWPQHEADYNYQPSTEAKNMQILELRSKNASFVFMESGD